MPAKKKDPISRLGFGATGAWGQRWFSQHKAERLVDRALERGITHFDTAGFYSGGVAETRLGNALKNTSRENLHISSKVGTRYSKGRAIKDFSVASIRSDVNASLKRLRREQIDVLYLHGPTIEQIDGTQNVLSMLKQEGKIGAIGVCGEGEQLAHAIKIGWVDAIMGLYNAFDQSHATLFQRARRKKIHTVGIAPLGQALYRPGFMVPKSPADAWYLARAVGTNGAKLKHARIIAANALGAVDGHSPASAMMGFAFANKQIDLILTNTTRLEHLDEVIDTATGPALDKRTLAQIAKLERKQE